MDVFVRLLESRDNLNIEDHLVGEEVADDVRAVVCLNLGARNADYNVVARALEGGAEVAHMSLTQFSCRNEVVHCQVGVGRSVFKSQLLCRKCGLCEADAYRVCSFACKDVK